MRALLISAATHALDKVLRNYSLGQVSDVTSTTIGKTRAKFLAVNTACRGVEVADGMLSLRVKGAAANAGTAALAIPAVPTKAAFRPGALLALHSISAYFLSIVVRGNLPMAKCRINDLTLAGTRLRRTRSCKRWTIGTSSKNPSTTQLSCCALAAFGCLVAARRWPV